MKKLKIKLSTGLIVLFLIISLMPMLIISSIIYKSTSNNLKKQIVNSFIAISEGREHAIVLFLEEEERMSAAFSSDGSIREMVEKMSVDVSSNEKLSKKLSMYLKNDKLPINKYIYEIMVLNMHGKIIASSNMDSIGKDKSKDDYFLGGIKGFYLKDAYLSETTGKESLAFSNPLKSKITGDVIGVLVNRVNFNLINKITTNREGMGETGEVYIVNKDGYMITESRFLKNIFLKQKVDIEAVRLFREGIKMMSGIYLDYRGEQVVGTSMGDDIPERYGLEWVIMTEIDMKEVFLPIINLAKVIGLLIFFISGVVFCVAYFISKKISSQFLGVVNIADKIAEGDLDSTIVLKGFHEVELLGNSLVRMQTQIKDRSEQVKESENKNRIIVDTSADGIVTITEKGVMQMVNSSLCQMFGYLKNELIDQNIKILMPEYYKNEHDGYLHNYLKTGIKKMIGLGRELEGQRKDGTIFPIYLTVSEIKLKNKIIFAGIIRDISETKQKESDLCNVAEKQEIQLWMIKAKNTLGDAMRGSVGMTELCSIVATSLAGIVKADISAVYISQEDKSLKLLGSYAFKDRKNNFNEFHLGEGLVGQVALEKKSILFTEVSEDSAKINYGIGEVLPKCFFIVPVVYENYLKAVITLGSLKEFSLEQRSFLDQVSLDIGIAFNSIQSQEKIKVLLSETQQQSFVLKESELKLQNQQEELRATNEELEEKTENLQRQQMEVVEKNNELEEAGREIEIKAKEIEEASSYKSEFLANMSHELRTPLNSLLLLAKGFADNEDGNLTEEQIEAAKIIHGSGFDLLGLINEILDLSKVESGKMDVYEDNIKIEDIILNITRNFSHVAKDKGVKLQVTKGNALPEMFKSDIKKIEQILKNLLSNAFKFTEKGTVGVNISYLEQEHQLLIAVSDSGIGIPLEKQGMVFEAFKQADGSTKRKYGGTGLGLSISKKFAEVLGGEIVLKSEEGEGSTFTLILPVEKIKGEKAVVEKVSEIKDEFIPAIRKESNLAEIKGKDVPVIQDDRQDLLPEDKTILIIEDDPNFSKILLNTARKKGFKGLLAFDGALGVKTAQEFQPKAIILDIMLPGMDGWTVMELLKNDPQTRHIPVHFVSALEEDMDAFKKGAIGYLSKPISKEDMFKVFERIEDFIVEKMKHVLIVGQKQEREEIVAMVEGEGIEVTESADGQSALKFLETCSYDCIISNVDLSDMLIFEFLNQLQKMDSVEKLPIIITHTNRELSQEEEITLKEYAQNNVIKEVKSSGRLLDETVLFLHKVESDLPKEQQETIRMLHDTDAILKGKKILVVDDDIRNTFSLSHILKRKGVEVFMAENGALALISLEEHPDIDLVLMDIMMPVMDGYQAMVEIRKQKRFAHLPVLALTAKAMKGDREECIEAGASDYLSKPVDVEKLFSMMRVWLYQ